VKCKVSTARQEKLVKRSSVEVSELDYKTTILKPWQCLEQQRLYSWSSKYTRSQKLFCNCNVYGKISITISI